MMAQTGPYPTRNFGSLPELDNFIKRGSNEVPDKRWKHNGVYFPTLVAARLEATKVAGLQSKYPNAEAILAAPAGKVAPSKKPTFKKPKVKNTRTYTKKITPDLNHVLPSTIPQRMTKNRLAAMDPYNMRERTFVRVAGVEISLAPNADRKHIVEVISAARVIAGKK
jgi:hypothetical protein